VEIRLVPRSVTRVLSFCAVCLAVANFIVQIAIHCFQQDFLCGLVPLFNLDQERSLPTYYSTITLFVCSMLLASIAAVQRKNGRRIATQWFALSAIFLFLSADEMLMLHEGLIVPLRSAFHARGIFYFTWVIPYGLFLLAFLAIFWRFLMNLPRQTRRLFMAAGVVYVAGALGFDLIGGYYFDHVGTRDVVYAILFSIEEMLEMAGIILFIHTLLQYIQNELQGWHLIISPSQLVG